MRISISERVLVFTSSNSFYDFIIEDILYQVVIQSLEPAYIASPRKNLK